VERERERERTLLGILRNGPGGSRAAPAHGLGITGKYLINHTGYG
jgi:hypothetical protein